MTVPDIGLTYLLRINNTSFEMQHVRTESPYNKGHNAAEILQKPATKIDKCILTRNITSGNA
jgi:hypothetical protein